MFYFVGNNRSKITGIEKAIINRLNLFKEYHYSARIVLLAWNRYLTDTASNYITNEDYINMYDYFQESTNVMSIFSKIGYIIGKKNVAILLEMCTKRTMCGCMMVKTLLCTLILVMTHYEKLIISTILIHLVEKLNENSMIRADF